MKIAFIMSSPIISSSNGVLSQAMTWKEGLESLGNTVHLVSPFEPQNWKEFDIIHFFVFSEYMADFVESLYKVNQNIVLSPILDTTYSVKQIALLSKWGHRKLRLTNKYRRLRDVKSHIKLVLVRSNFEKKYFTDAFDMPEGTVQIVPLSFGTYKAHEVNRKKENHCFHLSFLADDRKNVKRLILAAEKYNFKLRLAGRLRNEKEKEKINTWLKASNNVEYLGFLSKEDLINEYSKAKVFALPSINEGVGLVALEAASYGCDIVVTNVGGPQEYYGEYAKKVNPLSVNEIGNGIRFFLDGNTYQPQLKEYIVTNYNLDKTITLLNDLYLSIIKQ